MALVASHSAHSGSLSSRTTERSLMSSIATEYEAKVLREIAQHSANNPNCLVVGIDTDTGARQVVSAAGQQAICITLDGSELVNELSALWGTLPNHSVRHVILVGNTEAECESGEDVSQAAANQDVFDRLVHGACTMERRLADAKQRLSELCQQLENLRQTVPSDEVNSLQLTGLLFVSHSDFFLRYEHNQNSFVPLRKATIEPTIS